jgi:hypothetical protein
MMKIRVVLVTLALIGIASFAFASGQTEEAAGSGSVDDPIQPATYTWTAGGMGGGWYTTAGGMAAMVTEAEPSITIKVIPGGGMENPLKLASDQMEIGWGVSFIDKAAYAGTAPLFDRAFDNFSGLAGNFSVDYYHYLAAESTGITTFEEFVELIKSGEAVKVAAPMAGTSGNTMTGFLLDYYGLSFEAIEDAGGQVTYAVYGDMVNLYKDRHVDFVIAALGLPGAAMTEMAISRPSTLLEMTDEAIEYLSSTFGTVSLDSGVSFIPAGTYAGIDRDIQAIGHSTGINAGPSLPDNVAYLFVKTLIENIEEVQALSPSFAKYFSPESAPNTVVPLHPGAERYYREAGLID